MSDTYQDGVMWIEYKIFLQKESDLEKSVAFIKDAIIDKVSSYLWHTEPFQLTINQTGILGGRVVFGDSMQDEWMVMSILNQISMIECTYFQFPVIQVFDSDGDFLLIEAADHLPKFINEKTAKNRVYFCLLKVFWHKGKLVLLPLSVCNTDGSQDLTLEEAAEIIMEVKEEFFASPSIQEAIKLKLNEFEADDEKRMHLTNIALPRSVANLIHMEPNLVSCAVEAFTLRDTLSLRSIQGRLKFPLEHITIVPCSFSRLQYAMLQSDQLNMKLFDQLKVTNEKAGSLGTKICCGFEILAAEKKFEMKNYRPFPSEAIADRRKRFECFMEGFTFTDYLYFLVSSDEFANMNLKLKAPTEEDSDSWLDIDPVELEEELKSKESKMSSGQSGKVNQVISEMKQFMSKESEYDGVVLEDEEIKENDKEDDEYQVLQTVLHDPDLMMKMIEKNAEMGIDSKEMLRKLSQMAYEMNDGPESQGESSEDYDVWKEDFEEEYMDDQDLELYEKLQSDLKNIGEDADVNLATNLFESLKTGDGPGYNLMKSMGLMKSLLKAAADEDAVDNDEDSDFYQE